jgi:dihydroneopterin aldolase/2-amino-4-hydroxy-6-hydroxymethyldihydropteridine diphosphokinase
MSDKISLTGISGFGYHGVLESERKNGQEFLVDVVLYCDLSEAGKSDDLSKTINYADVAALIHKRIIGEQVNLLERLAELIAEDIFKIFEINEIEVTVHKPQAPIPLLFTDVSVSIKRKR